VLRGVSAGLMVAYNTFANDLEGVNYSSIRAGVLDEREQWKSLQVWMIEGLMDRVFADWLSMTLVKGVLKLPSSKYDKFNQPAWIGRRWAWVDPEKDMQAHILARQAGFETSSEIVGEQGGDLEEKYATIARERQMAKKHDLELTVDQAKSVQPTDQQKKSTKEQGNEA
jgi:lambda family phage portal protein